MKLARPTKLVAPFMLVIFVVFFRLTAFEKSPISATGIQQLYGPTVITQGLPTQAHLVKNVSVTVKDAPAVSRPTVIHSKTINSAPIQAPYVEPNFAPVLPTLTPADTQAPDLSEDLMNLIQQVKDGTTTSVRGVEVDGVFALPVLQQPKGDWTYVSTQDDVTTQFSSAAANGITGILAHNFLAGKLFYDVKLGQEIQVVYGDGSIRSYRVSEISRFQKLNSASLYSDMIDLQTGMRLSSGQIFSRFYTGSDHVTLQTCLEKNGDPSWGLTFIVAEPIH